ncbi:MULTISPECIES: ABC transporter substrate-binding protein [unclassified Pseudodesulfovibrio]|uniref:ABC transporter substrate-binding protein n=1 Tax=unclassified Pseudodesulfovibrio TaxID=2661612 RepID=UPI000FEB6838|nr:MULTISPECIES: ABC transporter substrate-binding protein [unclassified Pseudodesulfovibrio]MCJ2163002.1 ABC transporter substrate-binding protein [Pseudodesulfovibrio sp. S3-i]RWU06998.1 ABC transporter substrate-binding protein [Pseudodesulfovibrio sp. S3]
MKRLLFTLFFTLLLHSPANSQTLTDHSGRTIEVKAPFTRIISLYGAHTENLFSLGLNEEIVGVSTSEDYPMAVMEKPAFNARDGVEKFLAAEPDLILIRPMLRRGYPGLWAALEKRGITVVSLQPDSVEQMYDYWRTLGHLTGRELQAEYMIEDFQEGISRTEQRLASLTEDRRPGVFFESIHAKLATFSPGAMPLFVLEKAGGINVADDARPRHGTNIADYGLERLLARGSRIDVYLAQYGTMNEVSIPEIKNGPASSRIKAVLSGNVFLVDEHLVSRPTMRLLQGIEIIYQLLHP